MGILDYAKGDLTQKVIAEQRQLLIKVGRLKLCKLKTMEITKIPAIVELLHGSVPAPLEGVSLPLNIGFPHQHAVSFGRQPRF